MAIEVRSFHPHESGLDEEQAVTVLSEAFAEDPSSLRMVALARGSRSGNPLRELFSLQLREERSNGSVVDIVVDTDSDQIKGVGIWTPPNVQGGLINSLKHLPDYVAVFGSGLPAAIRQIRRSESLHPKFPHWYLHYLAVSPEAQGQGVGGALLDQGLSRAGDHAAYLEASTPDSARLYARKGFAVMGLIPSGDDGVDETGMWRSPNLHREA